MKTKLSILIFGLIIAAALIIPGVSAANSETGNGAMSGPHFTLNLIGMEKNKNLSDDPSYSHAMFVEYSRTGSVSTRIDLREGDFMILDRDGTDGRAAFQLPYPYTVFTDDPLTGSEQACYLIFAKALGKPGGSAMMEACAYDTIEEATYCYEGTTIPIERPTAITGKNGPSKFVDITKQLTQVSINGDKYAIFSNTSYQYFWDYDNNKLRHAQLRLYPIADCDEAPPSPYF